ncbi:hypothetical protein VTJ49DRAFT_4294 [Mycothermus thermophilus]|uniref:Protein kinase domain-containing protein n=1 Tax=Humicola insolens TaxID=85995 RepID=A0ABR3V5Q4_HUMIN
MPHAFQDFKMVSELSGTKMPPQRQNLLRVIDDEDEENYERADTRLGSGSFGTVTTATRIDDDRVVACKIEKFDPSYRRWDRGKPLTRQIKVWAQACQGANNVAQLLDAAYNPDTRTAYTYMELLSGGDIADLMIEVEEKTKRLLHPIVIYYLAHQVALGIQELHSRDVMHLDIKGENVLLTSRIEPEWNTALWEVTNPGHAPEHRMADLADLSAILFDDNERLAVLVDFGLSRVLATGNECWDPADATDPRGPTRLPDGGAMLWVQEYHAPELVASDHQSKAADIYSFGNLVYFMCSFHCTENHLDYKPLSDQYRALQSLVDRCTAASPANRPNIAAVVSELSAIMDDGLKKLEGCFEASLTSEQREKWERMKQGQVNGMTMLDGGFEASSQANMRLLRLVSLAAAATASVVIIPGDGDPKPYQGPPAVTSEDDFFRQSAPNEFYNNTAKLILTSLSATTLSEAAGIRPSGDSFIRGAIQAWGEHLHFVIRPDEVWFTILVQMNFYMISHAEEIRSLFVDHEGQAEIYVEDYTWYDVLIRFKDEIQKRVKTDWLLDWITPNFSTTTESDIMTANVLMMGLTKAYFKYIGKVVCGLPSVTLLGERSDWQRLLDKLAYLPEFGKEPAEYAARLRPILTRFVESFDRPDDPELRKFWNQIVSARPPRICGDPPVFLSGWITGFYYWNDNGGPFARTSSSDLVIDGVPYPVLDLEFAPVGYAKAPFLMLDHEGQAEFPAFVAAGTLGKQITEGPPEGYQEALKRVGEQGVEDVKQHATLKPMSAWMLYGPLEHNRTQTIYGVAEDLWGTMFSAKRYMTGDTCGLV